MRKIVSTFVVAAAFGLSACAGQSDTTQRTVSGGAIGAAGGAVIGAIAGNAGLGLAIGAATGAAGGYIYDQHKKAEEVSYQKGVEAGKQMK